MIFAVLCAENLARICVVPAILNGAYQGYWTSGKRSTVACGNEPFVWKNYPGTNVPVGYTNWASGKPDCVNGNEMCIQLTTPDYYDERWDDKNCAWPLCAMCEMDM